MSISKGLVEARELGGTEEEAEAAMLLEAGLNVDETGGVANEEADELDEEKGAVAPPLPPPVARWEVAVVVAGDLLPSLAHWASKGS